jgi:CRP-like cAMP-binding protein
VTATEERIQSLASIPLFSELDQDALHQVGGLIIDFDAPPGQLLIEPHTVGQGLFIIEDGTVVASVRGHDVELSAGEFVGELSLLDDRATRTARVRARTPVRGCCIRRDDFLPLLEAQPRIALAMLKIMAARLHDALH